MKQLFTQPLGRIVKATIAVAMLLGLGSGCELRQRMYDQEKFEPYEKTDFFGDNRSARHYVEGTVARGYLNDDEHLHTGQIDGQFTDIFPFEITEEVLDRGESRYNIYCAVCHGATGVGDGMIVKRGYKKPPTYHDDRMRGQPAGYYYNVITQGFGVMPNYAYQLEPEDRWAVVAYIRALQLSQNQSIDDVPADKKDQLAGTE